MPTMTTTFFLNGRSQAVRLPKERRLPGKEVTIRRLGDGVFIEPMAAKAWPDGFFDSILIEDESFERPAQGTAPPLPSFEA